MLVEYPKPREVTAFKLLPPGGVFNFVFEDEQAKPEIFLKSEQGLTAVRLRDGQLTDASPHASVQFYPNAFLTLEKE